MFFHNTKYLVGNILDNLGGIPEECSWVDYKASCEFNKEFKDKIKSLVIAFLNSIQAFDKDKYIIFGVFENKVTKIKRITGLGNHKFPDDNEWQNIFIYIQPSCPYIETGTLEYKGLLLGYICIFAQNYSGPYSYSKGNKIISYPIRVGGNKREMTEDDKSKLISMSKQIIHNGRNYVKSDILNILVTIGQYNSSNQNDINLIENRTGRTYAYIKQYCLNMDNLFTQDEKSIYGIGESITVKVQEKHGRLLQFTSDEVFCAMELIDSVLKAELAMFSHELIKGIADTLIFLADHGYSYPANRVIESAIDIRVIQKSRYPILSQIAEISPAFLLKLIMEHKAEIMKERESKENAIQVLRTVVWYPEHYTEATKLLIELGDSAIYEVFECGEMATAACFEQKLKLIREMVKSDRDLVFLILNKVLDFNPNMPRVLIHDYVPEKYKRLRNGTHSFKIDQLQIYADILINIAESNVNKILELLPRWLKPYPFSNLWRLAECIERVEPIITSIDEREELWYRLCIMPLVYVTNEPIEGALKERLVEVGAKFKPDSLLSQKRQWFRESIRQDLTIDGSGWDDVCEKIFVEQKKVLLTLYKQDGIEKLIEFIRTVNIDSFQLAQMLLSSDFLFTIEEENILISEYFDSPEKYVSYFVNKSYFEKLDWIKKLKVDSFDINKKADFFVALNPSLENIKYFEEILGDEIKLYWEKVACNRFADVLSIQYGFEKFIEYEMPKKAFDLLNSIQINQIRKQDAEWLFRAIMTQEEYNECYLSKSAYEAAYRILYDKIDENMLETMEHLSFCLYEKIAYHMPGYAGLKPIITFKKIASDPSFFAEIVKCVIEDSWGLWEHIIRSCDQKPELPVDWANGIDYLMRMETEKIRKKGEYWTGYILYNTVKICLSDEYEILDCVAELLEKSKDKREGFFCHAYYSLNGFHANGSFEYDAKDRKDAEKYKKLADVQKRKGNNEFSKSLYELANQLIRSVET